MADISWVLVIVFGLTGVGMALLSCLVGLRPRLENPLWWGLYAVWIAVVILVDSPSPFWTLLVSSVLAGVLHGTTSALLLDRYVASNPWHAERLRGPRSRQQRQFLVIGTVVGVIFGAIVGGIGSLLSRWL